MNTQDGTDVSINKMKTTVHIPKGGVPPWHLPTEADTRVHAVLRGMAFAVVGLLYLTLMVLHFLQIIRLSMHAMTLLATMMVLSIPAIQYLVRPGKGATWFVTIVLMPIFIFMPITIALLIVVVPITLLITQACQGYKNTQPTNPSDGPEEA